MRRSPLFHLPDHRRKPDLVGQKTGQPKTSSSPTVERETSPKNRATSGALAFRLSTWLNRRPWARQASPHRWLVSRSTSSNYSCTWKLRCMWHRACLLYRHSEGWGCGWSNVVKATSSHASAGACRWTMRPRFSGCPAGRFTTGFATAACRRFGRSGVHNASCSTRWVRPSGPNVACSPISDLATDGQRTDATRRRLRFATLGETWRQPWLSRARSERAATTTVTFFGGRQDQPICAARRYHALGQRYYLGVAPPR